MPPRLILLAALLGAACAVTDPMVERPAQTEGAASTGAAAPGSRLVHMEMRYEVRAPGETERARFLLLVPKDLPGRQRVRSLEWILPPTKTYERPGGLEAEWIFDQPKGSFELGCVLSVELSPFDLSSSTLDLEADPVVLDTYLRDEEFLEKHAPRVARAARELAPTGAEGLELLRALFALEPVSSGQVKINGAVSQARSPRERLDQGVGLLSEDRKGEGLALDLDLATNATLTLGALARSHDGRRMVSMIASYAAEPV